MSSLKTKNASSKICLFSKKHIQDLTMNIEMLRYEIVFVCLYLQVGLEKGIEMLDIFISCEMRSSILDDFNFYEERQIAIQDRKARQRAVLESLALSATSAPTYSLHDDFVREMSKHFAEALALQHRPK
jgi:hypothetical protein